VRLSGRDRADLRLEHIELRARLFEGDARFSRPIASLL
jgi:hypothetical protein